MFIISVDGQEIFICGLEGRLASFKGLEWKGVNLVHFWEGVSELLYRSSSCISICLALISKGLMYQVVALIKGEMQMSLLRRWRECECYSLCYSLCYSICYSVCYSFCYSLQVCIRFDLQLDDVGGWLMECILINYIRRDMLKYVKLADMLREILGGSQIKEVIYRRYPQDDKRLAVSAAYSLLSTILNNYSMFQQSLQCIQQRQAEKGDSIANPMLIYVMIAEFINTGKIVGGGKIKRIIMDSRDCLPCISKSKIKKSHVQVRVRGDSALKTMIGKYGEEDGLVEGLYSLPYQTYSSLVKNEGILSSKDCVVQGFSSSLPAVLLMRSVKEKCKAKAYDVIDACAAPGNKTSQLADTVGTNGTVFAFQKSQKRYGLLCQTVDKYGLDNVSPILGSFLSAQPRQYPKVRFILLDPSCSGSGMLSNSVSDGSAEEQGFQEYCERRYRGLNEDERARVERLHEVQLRLLRHAGTFKPVRLSYSTCSVYKRENEDVVEAFLKMNRHYRIKRYFLKSKYALSEGFGSCRDSLRVDPRKGETDGFYVCVFTRL